MSVLGKIRARLRNEDLAGLRAEVEAQRAVIHQMNHAIGEIRKTLDALNHDVRSGADIALPLYLGYVERLRVDAETAIAATQVIERQLARIDPARQPPPSDE